jgi:hypothetical protein
MIVAPHRAAGRELRLGSQVWAPIGEHGWRPGTITGFGKHCAAYTVVNLHFENDGSGQCFAAQLYARNPLLKGKDKPNAETLIAQEHLR